MSLENFKVSQKAKEQLIRLKMATGIEHWNILCRWAFCLSLSEPSKPAPTPINTDSNVEMNWRVFAGKYSEIYMALLKQRCLDDGLEINETNLKNQFKLHLHRGISYLAEKRFKSIEALLELAVA